MASACLPPFLIIAEIIPHDKNARDRFLELTSPIAASAKENEPDTLPYYFFTGTGDNDTMIYAFEGYPNKTAWTDIHLQSASFKSNIAIVQEEKLVTPEIHLCKPLSGFILRTGQPEKSAELVVIHQILKCDAEFVERLSQYAKYVESIEGDGCSTFVVMQELDYANCWTFERYATEKFWTEEHCRSPDYINVFGETNSVSQTVSVTLCRETGVGYLTRE